MASNQEHPNVFACPHCGEELVNAGATAACRNGHSFDRAKEGYLNLLIAGRLTTTTTPGDTAVSLAARRAFLSTGAYRPIAEALTEIVGVVDGPVLDVGCGEGWYLSQFANENLFGIDISRKAVQMACRSVPRAAFAVASAYRLPVLDSSCTAVFSVFAPHPLDEFVRVLQPGGLWVTVTPGPDHLMEMRPAYDPSDTARARFDKRATPPPEAKSSARVRYVLQLDNETANNLFTMTPLQWQTGALRDGTPEVTVDVWVSSARRD